MKKIQSVFVLTILICINATSQTTQDLRIRSVAVPFLRIAPDARAAGMGDNGIATLPDANAPFWNLAKTPFAKAKTAFSLTYTPWLKDLGLTDVYLASLGGYHKLGDGEAAIGGGLRFFSLGNIQFTDFAGNNLATFRPREMAIDFGYARKLCDRLSIAAALRYINSNLATGNFSGTDFSAGSTVAGDLSLYYDGTQEELNGGGFAWGIAISNLGGKIGYTNNNQNRDFIPANLGLGVQYTKAIDDVNKITFALDINKSLVPAPPVRSDITGANNDSIDIVNYADYRSQSVLSSWGKSFSDGTSLFKSMTYSLGVEYNYADQFFFRAGYFHEDVTEGNRKFVSVGAGIKFNSMTVNLSYIVPAGQGVNRNPLSNTLRFGIAFDLNADETN